MGSVTTYVECGVGRPILVVVVFVPYTSSLTVSNRLIGIYIYKYL